SPPDGGLHRPGRRTLHANPDRGLVEADHHHPETPTRIHRPTRRPRNHVPTRHPRRRPTAPGRAQYHELKRVTKLVQVRSKCGRTKEKDDGKFTPATVVRYARLLVSILPGR